MRIPRSRHQRAASGGGPGPIAALLEKRLPGVLDAPLHYGLVLRVTHPGRIGMKPRCWEYSRKPRVKRGCRACAGGEVVDDQVFCRRTSRPPDDLLQLLAVGGPHEAMPGVGQHHQQRPYRLPAAGLPVLVKPSRPKSSSATCSPPCSWRGDAATDGGAVNVPGSPAPPATPCQLQSTVIHRSGPPTGPASRWALPSAADRSGQWQQTADALHPALGRLGLSPAPPLPRCKPTVSFDSPVPLPALPCCQARSTSLWPSPHRCGNGLRRELTVAKARRVMEAAAAGSAASALRRSWRLVPSLPLSFHPDLVVHLACLQFLRVMFPVEADQRGLVQGVAAMGLCVRRADGASLPLQEVWPTLAVARRGCLWSDLGRRRLRGQAQPQPRCEVLLR